MWFLPIKVYFIIRNVAILFGGPNRPVVKLCSPFLLKKAKAEKVGNGGKIVFSFIKKNDIPGHSRVTKIKLNMMPALTGIWVAIAALS